MHVDFDEHHNVWHLVTSDLVRLPRRESRPCQRSSPVCSKTRHVSSDGDATSASSACSVKGTPRCSLDDASRARLEIARDSLKVSVGQGYTGDETPRKLRQVRVNVREHPAVRKDVVGWEGDSFDSRTVPSGTAKRQATSDTATSSASKMPSPTSTREANKARSGNNSLRTSRPPYDMFL